MYIYINFISTPKRTDSPTNCSEIAERERQKENFGQHEAGVSPAAFMLCVLSRSWDHNESEKSYTQAL